MKMSRRTILQAGAGTALALAGGRLIAEEQSPGTMLILGGTGFIGPHLTELALAKGWKVTHFNRGKRDADGVPNVETLHGDRKGQLDSLKDRKWDVVVDNTGYIPKYQKMSADLLAPNTGYCLYISSISAYASFAKPNDIGSPTGVLENKDQEEITNETYGPMKALCEQYVRDAYGARSSIVRPGYIVGPLDPTDRFTYWPVRVARGGDMAVPGTPADPIQIVDVRDLVAFMMGLVERRVDGYLQRGHAARRDHDGPAHGYQPQGQRRGPEAHLDRRRLPRGAPETRRDEFRALGTDARRGSRRIAHRHAGLRRPGPQGPVARGNRARHAGLARDAAGRAQGCAQVGLHAGEGGRDSGALARAEGLIARALNAGRAGLRSRNRLPRGRNIRQDCVEGFAMRTVRQLLEGKKPGVVTIDAARTGAGRDPVDGRSLHRRPAGARGGQLAGIVSERDYARKVVLMGRKSTETTVGTIMSTPVIHVGPAQTVNDCMKLMTEKRIRHLPVVENGDLVGVISIGDLVKAVIDEQKHEIEDLRRYIAG